MTADAADPFLPLALLEGTADAVCATDEHGHLAWWNPAAERTFDIPEHAAGTWTVADLGFDRRCEDAVEAALAGTTAPDLHAPGGPAARRRRFSLTVSPLAPRSGAAGASVIARALDDGHDDRAATPDLHDGLTGLPRRTLFNDRLSRALAPRPSGDGAVALIAVDLDGFHVLNDILGQEAGDAALVEVARHLEAEIRPSDTLARTGSDEFAVLIDDLDRNDGIRVALGIVDSVASLPRVSIDGEDYALRASAGVALVRPGIPPPVAQRSANVALQTARARGGGCYEVFDPGAHADAVDRHRLELDLARAAERSELVLHYQPVIDLENEDVLGVEALVRWQHPERGLLAPGDFVPLAEASGMIVEIDRWVLDEACRQLAEWQRGAPAMPREASVNLSARQLHRPGLFDEVSEALFRHDVDPGALTLEVTETALMAHPDAAIGMLEKLDRLGVAIALDDFGTGYSSLGYLRRLPISTLKVDRAFVEGIAREPEEWALASAIVKMARSLDKQTVAEGVEQPAQLAHLRTLGCDAAQGYLFTRPLPPSELGSWLTGSRNRR